MPKEEKEGLKIIDKRRFRLKEDGTVEGVEETEEKAGAEKEIKKEEIKSAEEKIKEGKKIMDEVEEEELIQLPPVDF